MRRKTLIFSIMVLAMAMIMMVSCGGSTLSGDMNADGKSMTITAEKAAEGDFIVVGSLEVGENEQITIDSNLESGGMQIEFISSEGMDDIDEIPDVDDAEANYTADINGIESQALMFGAGSYVLRITVTEKATGTAEILVKGFDD